MYIHDINVDYRDRYRYVFHRPNTDCSSEATPSGALVTPAPGEDYEAPPSKLVKIQESLAISHCTIPWLYQLNPLIYFDIIISPIVVSCEIIEILVFVVNPCKSTIIDHSLPIPLRHILHFKNPIVQPQDVMSAVHEKSHETNMESVSNPVKLH